MTDVHDVPARWLTEHARLLPPGGDALDVACGRGRHALWLAAQGYRVRAIDRDAARVHALAQEAAARRLPVRAEVLDLEAGGVTLGRSAFDVIVVVHYLHRPLFPLLLEALRPGGTLVYETFLRQQAGRGKPTNPAFLLEPGELARLVAPLEILVEREGDHEGRFVASVVARRPS
ncbi:MAG TPA: methyltransferase domain-containing protein [Vicinamibacterales bacterium]|nr:methyltransferase domain-containing protein [Vicinamibacterales bacterium]